MDIDTDTAHLAWDAVWKTPDGNVEWGSPEPSAIDWAVKARLAGARTALDLGCGVGRHALAMAALGMETTAFDRSETGLARTAALADARGLSLTTRAGAMTELPFADGAFDYVLSWNVIYHGDPDIVAKAVAEIARVTRPGGLLHVTLLSKRRADFGRGQEIAPDTFVQPDGAGDKAHPHFFCDAAGVVALLLGFEVLELRDEDPDGVGEWHWNAVARRSDA